MIRCPFCDEPIKFRHQPHHAVCDDYALKYPNATRATAFYRPDLLTRYLDKYGDTGYICVADWTNANLLLLRVFFSTGRPKWQQPHRRRDQPFRFLIHRDNIAQVNYGDQRRNHRLWKSQQPGKA